MSNPLPASSTKHLDVVHHPLPRDRLVLLPLRQISSSPSSTGSSSTGTTGTTLWLGGQVLSCYLSSLGPSNGGKRAIELGAGTGYLSLVLASLGYHVTTTDIQPVLDDVLRPNIASGLDTLRRATNATPIFSGRAAPRDVPRSSKAQREIGDVEVQELDWEKCREEKDVEGLAADLIITSDTIYNADLLPHLFRTINLISSISERSRGTSPTLYLCLERRDSRMVDSALHLASTYNIQLKRIGQGRIVKCVRETGWGWQSEDWEGVEVYKGRWARSHADASR